MKNELRNIFSDLRYFTLRPRRIRIAPRLGEDGWREELRRYGNAEKRILSSDFRWYVLEFKDGKKELAYLRVLQGGLLSGLSPAIYRGCIIPRRIDYVTFSGIGRIRLAF